MSLDKVVPSAADAVADITGGSSLAVGGFGLVGIPWYLIAAVLEQGAPQQRPPLLARRSEVGNQHGLLRGHCIQARALTEGELVLIQAAAGVAAAATGRSAARAGGVGAGAAELRQVHAVDELHDARRPMLDPAPRIVPGKRVLNLVPPAARHKGTMAVDDNGNVYVAWARQEAKSTAVNTYVAASTDHGATWTSSYQRTAGAFVAAITVEPTRMPSSRVILPSVTCEPAIVPTREARKI